MRHTTRHTTITAIAGAALVGAACADSMVRVTSGDYQQANAGEFRIVPMGSGNVGVTGLSPDGPDSFQTFCVERNRPLRLGDEYRAEVATFADDGGVGGPTPDPLSPQTAFLYHAFRYGELGNYDYDDSQGERMNDALSLQLAIWLLEDEITPLDGRYRNDSYAQSLVALAEASGWETIRNVRILNLTTMNGETAQSQLTVIIPLPHGAGLASLGLVAVGVRRRRQG